MLCILDKGAERATVKATVSGRGHGFNTVYPTYSIVAAEYVKPSTRTEQIITLFEEETPAEDIVQRYKFGSTDDYVDIAKDYQDYLLAQNPALAQKETTDIPVYMELLGGISVTKPVMGVPTEFVEPLTTFDSAWEMLSEMDTAGFKNINAVYTGWMNAGIDHEIVMNGINVIGSLGGKGDLEKLIKNVNSNIY